MKTIREFNFTGFISNVLHQWTMREARTVSLGTPGRTDLSTKGTCQLERTEKLASKGIRRVRHAVRQHAIPRTKEKAQSRNTCQMFGITARSRSDAMLSTKLRLSSKLKLWLPRNTVLQLFLSQSINVAGGPAWIRTMANLLRHLPNLQRLDCRQNEGMNVLTASGQVHAVTNKFLRLRMPLTIRLRFGEWEVCWLGGWTQHRLRYLVMLVRCSRLLPKNAVRD